MSGTEGRTTFSAALTERRLTGSVRAPEAFWHELAPEGSAKMFHQDLSTWLTVEAPESSPFLRSRLLPKCRGWEQVIVIGEEGFRVTTATLGSWAVEGDSVGVAKHLGLQFATVSWGIPSDDTACPRPDQSITHHARVRARLARSI
jgi:hypothetical protein